MIQYPFLPKIGHEEISKLPLKQFEGKIHLIENSRQLENAIDIIGNVNILGFDTETKPNFKKGESNPVSLLQLTTNQQAFIIRLKSVGLPSSLINILQNPDIIKPGIAIKDDLKSLKKINDFKPAGFVELQEYVKKFGIENNGLKQITAIVLGFRITKSQQTSNWDSKQLTESQLLYAATDAWACFKIYETLNALDKPNHV